MIDGASRLFRIGIVIAAAFATFLSMPAIEPPAFTWRQLPPLPDPFGFASPFVGVSHETLVVAGGANFPEQQLWQGGRKIWHDRVFVLRPGTERWEMAGKLPQPMAYGVSISTDRGVLCIGGSDSRQHFTTVFELEVIDGCITFRNFPSLPKPLAMAAGVRIGHRIYLAGGLESPQSKQASSVFWVLDLEDLKQGWQALPTWPGPGRSQAVAAAVGDAFYLLSGLGDTTDTSDGPKLTFLKDAYRYSPSDGWRRLPDLPFATVAAVSPAPSTPDRFLVISGADGTGVGISPSSFHQAPQRIQSYSTVSNSWSEAGFAPVGRVCVTSTEWRGGWIIATGERSPGVRSPEIWQLFFK
jgi:N-acetylneuraminate epimerase